MPTSLGSKIKTLRNEKGHTLEQLADLTDSSKSYIWELENKNPPRPSAEKLSRIAKELGVTIGYLIGEEESVTKEVAEDAAFYREYQSMDAPIKAKIRDMVKLWSEDDE